MWAFLVAGGMFVFAAYVLIGYPVAAALAARRRGRPVRKQFTPRTVSILLAVRNGEKDLDAKVDSLLDLDYPLELVEIFVLSDGSTDGTVARARERAASVAARGARLEVFDLPAGGKSAALNAGLEKASGEILFFTDVRQPLARPALRELVACFGDPGVGTVSGELVIRRGNSSEEAQTGLYWRYEKRIRFWQSAIDSVIGATGAIYAQRRDLCIPLPADTLLDDVHQPLAAFFAGYRVILDSAAQAFDQPTRLDQEFRRKVRTLAGNYQIIYHYPALFSSANRMRWHFLSHKFALLVAARAVADGIAGRAGAAGAPGADRPVAPRRVPAETVDFSATDISGADDRHLLRRVHPVPARAELLEIGCFFDRPAGRRYAQKV
jgi:biofilm PGA synthesis N-glycosyltransferase PgaC